MTLVLSPAFCKVYNWGEALGNFRHAHALVEQVAEPLAELPALVRREQRSGHLFLPHGEQLATAGHAEAVSGLLAPLSIFHHAAERQARRERQKGQEHG